MKRLIVIVVLLLEVVATSGEQCQTECPQCVNQPRPQDCKSGCLTKDRCGCCLMCAKAKNETCGGIDNYYGNCADGLYCKEISLLFGRCEELGCQPPCNIDNCGQADKDKICSATGVLKGESKTDGCICQHTTCGSCFFVPDPQCTPCEQYNDQTKKRKNCLKKYHACLRQHYRGSVIQNLTAVTKSNSTGVIFCKES